MLDLGFIHALKRIVKLLPRQRQTLLFSATMPRPIASLAEEYLNDPVNVAVTPAATTVERVDQSVVFVPSDREAGVARDVAAGTPPLRACSSSPERSTAPTESCGIWSDAGIEATAIHGNKSQPQRERALAGFRGGPHPRARRH